MTRRRGPRNGYFRKSLGVLDGERCLALYEFLNRMMKRATDQVEVMS